MFHILAAEDMTCPEDIKVQTTEIPYDMITQTTVQKGTVS